MFLQCAVYTGARLIACLSPGTVEHFETNTGSAQYRIYCLLLHIILSSKYYPSSLADIDTLTSTIIWQRRVQAVIDMNSPAM